MENSIKTVSLNTKLHNSATPAPVVKNNATPKPSKVAIPLNTFKLMVKIANSDKLTNLEKSSLIQSVAKIDTRSNNTSQVKALKDIAATTVFLENSTKIRNSASEPIKSNSVSTTSNSSSNNANNNATKQAIKQFVVHNNETKTAPIQTDTKAEVSQIIEQFRDVSFNEVEKQVSASQVQEIFNAQVEIPKDIKFEPAQSLGASNPNEVKEVQHKEEHTEDEMILPGNSSNSESFEYQPVGTSSEEFEIMAPLGGSSDTDIEFQGLGSGNSNSNFSEPLGNSTSASALTLPGGSSSDAYGDNSSAFDTKPKFVTFA